MGRSSFGGLLNAIARDIARGKREAEAERRRQLRASIRAQREEARALLQAQRDEKRQRALGDKEAKLQYVEERRLMVCFPFLRIIMHQIR